MSTGPRFQWGGRRPGSGKKSLPPMEKLQKKLLKLAAKYEKQYGKSMGDIIIELAYGKIDGIDCKIMAKDRLQAAKAFFDIVTTKGGESSAKKESEKPISLPDMKPDPAKIPLAKVAEA